MVWIDDYLRALSQQVLDFGGLVDDYFGDGMMAIFGAPVARDSMEEIQ